MKSPAFIIFLVAVAFVLLLGVSYYAIIRLNGLQVTSWWRSFWHNAAVGGKINSLHLWGLAFDVVPVTQGNETFLAGIGLKVINEGDHLHAQIL